MTFGDELKTLRERRRLSQSRLADMAGFDHSFISRLESGDRFPTRDAVRRLASALSATPIERDRLMTSAGFTGPADATSVALDDVRAERRRQMDRWGVQSQSWPEWILILTEELGEAAQAANEAHFRGAGIEQLRTELIQVAAVAVQIVEAIDSMEQEGEVAA